MTLFDLLTERTRRTVTAHLTLTAGARTRVARGALRVWLGPTCPALTRDDHA